MSGIMTVILGLIFLAVLKAACGSIFPTAGGAVLFVYLLVYVELALGIVFIYIGSKIEEKEKYIQSQPIKEVRARAIKFDRTREDIAGVVYIIFETSTGDTLRLQQQKKDVNYTYYEVGILRYQVDRIVSFIPERRGMF